MAPTKQSTRCIFVINNYTNNDIELLKPFHTDYCKCLVCGKEVGEVELTPHLQGFFTLKTKLSMTSIHKALGTKAIALKPASDTSPQAANYCKKGEQTKEEWESYKAFSFYNSIKGSIVASGRNNKDLLGRQQCTDSLTLTDLTHDHANVCLLFIEIFDLQTGIIIIMC